MKKIVITGGPYSGKTSIVNEFAKQRYATIPESAMQVIAELNKKLGIAGQKKWRMQNYAKYQAMIANKQVRAEFKVTMGKGEIMFCDRGLHESIAYCEFMQINVPKEILDLAEKHKYYCVFICDTLSSFNQRERTGRMSDQAASIKLKNLIKQVYRNHGCKIVHVKEAPIKQRVEFIKEHLGIR